MDILQAANYVGIFGSLLIFVSCIKSRSFIDFLTGLAFFVLFIIMLAPKGEPAYELVGVVTGLSLLAIAVLKLRIKSKKKKIADAN